MAGILALTFLSLCANPGWTENKIPDNFVDLQTVIPSVTLDIRYYGDHNFVGTRVDGYQAPKCLVTAPAAEALAKVQAELQEFSLSLKIYDCYRPQRAVDHFVRWAKDIKDTKTKAEFYPTVDKRNFFRDGYIAEKSGHSKGSTVDITIIPFPAPAEGKYIPGQPLHACYLPAGKRFASRKFESRAATAHQPAPAQNADGQARFQELRSGMVALHIEERALSRHLFRFPGEMTGGFEPAGPLKMKLTC
jgi:D-alanyl-D-alanine dipeptidase